MIFYQNTRCERPFRMVVKLRWDRPPVYCGWSLSQYTRNCHGRNIIDPYEYTHCFRDDRNERDIRGIILALGSLGATRFLTLSLSLFSRQTPRQCGFSLFIYFIKTRRLSSDGSQQWTTIIWWWHCRWDLGIWFYFKI